MGKRKAKKAKTHRVGEWIKRFILILILIMCVAVVGCVGIGIGMYASAVREIQSMNVKNLALNYSSTIYCMDSDGNAIKMEEIYNDGNRIWLESERIPQVMKDAIVAIEDERFYQHNGVDIKRTTGAFLGWVKAKASGGSTSYGGSTITQQVIKNITKEKDKTATRKVKEMLLAVALEKELTKDEILTIYLNLICLSNNCYGVEAASNMFYDKPAMELNTNQAATLAGITQRPTQFDPIRNPENAKNKRDVVVGKMFELDMISAEERDEIYDKDLELNVNKKMKEAKIFSYFTDNLLNEVIADLQKEAGYSKEMAEQLVYSGGLSIYSTVDLDIQRKMEDYYENSSNFNRIRKGMQSAMVVMDQYTGEIKGMVGGVGEKTESRGLNRAAQSKLQPGSAIKPLTVYGPALEEDLVNATTTVMDQAIKMGNWEPKNAYSGFKGRMSVRRAVQISSNIAAINVLKDSVGIDRGYDYITNKFGVTSLTESDKNYASLALGGLTKGVTPEEMTAAYGVFANGGRYIKPHSYSKVLDHSGNVLLENDTEGKQVIRDSTAFLMTDLLYSVVNESGGTGNLAKFSNSMPIYGKTGTTNDTKDKWFVGYTPYYVGAVWCGFDQPKSLGTSRNISAEIWGKIMGEIHEGLDELEFIPPDSVIKKGDEYFYVDSKLKKNSSIRSSSSKVSSTKKESEEKDSDKKGSILDKILNGENATSEDSETSESVDGTAGESSSSSTSSNDDAESAPSGSSSSSGSSAPSSQNESSVLSSVAGGESE